jgi:hypothetical protein
MFKFVVVVQAENPPAAIVMAYPLGMLTSSKVVGRHALTSVELNVPAYPLGMLYSSKFAGRHALTSVELKLPARIENKRKSVTLEIVLI